jgi:hypothetical protein
MQRGIAMEGKEQTRLLSGKFFPSICAAGIVTSLSNTTAGWRNFPFTEFNANQSLLL